MRRGAAQIVVSALEDEGIPFAFGIPGTHNIELYDALAESKCVRTVLVTDEQSASFLADGVWRASGKLACVNIVPGAGLSHAMSGIAEALLDNVPMLVLGCGIRRDSGRAFQLHDIDQQAMAAPVTKAHFLAERGSELYATVRTACRIATEGTPGPVFVEVPAHLYLSRHEQGEYVPEPLVAEDSDEDALASAVATLGHARRPLIYAGAGATGAAEGLLELAERLESPVATTFQGKGVFPESHPLALWPGFGDAAPPFARAIASRCDATLALGCRFGEVATGSYGLDPPRPLVHVDLDAGVFDRNYTADIAVAGDADRVVTALLSSLEPRERDDALRESIRLGREQVRRALETGDADERVSPRRLLAALQRRLGADTVYVTDSGNGTFLAVESLVLDKPRSFLAPVDYSCMGYAVPAAIGAKLACPERPVVALPGDGAFLMTGLELVTAAAQGVGVLVFVLRDGEYAQIAQFQRVALGRTFASRVPSYDLAALARSLGVECLQLDSDAEIDAIVDHAAELATADRPVVVDVAVDYSQTTYFTRGVVRTSFRRLGWRQRGRFATRALSRRLLA